MIGDLYEPGSRAAPSQRLAAARRELVRMTDVRATIYGVIAGIGVVWTLFTWFEARYDSPWSVLSWAVPVGAILGLLVIFGGGGLLAWLGRRLEGKASAEEVRAALGWSALATVPVLLLPPLLVLAMAITYFINKPELLQYRFLAGDEIVSPASYFLFHATADDLSAGLLPLLPLALGLVMLAATILFIKNYARANRFSPWRAATAVLLAPFAATVFIVFVVSALLLVVLGAL